MAHTVSAYAPARPQCRFGLLPLLLRLDGDYRQRRRLRDLPPHLLEDIGLTAEEAREIARQPAWDAPTHWRD